LAGATPDGDWVRSGEGRGGGTEPGEQPKRGKDSPKRKFTH